MLLGEPPRTEGDICFSFLGFPVRVHPLFWLMALILGMRLPGLPAILTWIIAVFLSILVHELGHAFVMRAHGYSPWITLYGMGGLASYVPGYSGRPTSRGQILISLAGPLAGFLLATLIIVPMVAADKAVLFPYGIGWRWIAVDIVGSERFTDFLWFMLQINVFWGLINLLPVYPLDGGHIAREVFLVFNSGEGIRRSLVLSIVTSVVLVVLALNSKRFCMALLFGYMGYSGYQTLQAYTHGRRW